MGRDKKIVYFLMLTIVVFFTSFYKVNASDEVYGFSYTGNYQEFIVPMTGSYKIEAWGAGGGTNTADGSSANITAAGRGAYVSGTINLIKGTKLYIYVGGKGANAAAYASAVGGYNGGGKGDYDHHDNEASGAGGGATDIRFVGGLWNDFASLKSRIMVAAGGGGASYLYAGGYGGALDGQSTLYSAGGTQTSGYAFGYGQSGVQINYNVDVAGGGGGYYGGYAKSSGVDEVYQAAGAGGSSFVSGCTGCDAIDEASTEENIIHTGNNIHYSGVYFTDITMTAGNAVMPNYSNTSTMTGNASNGYARITFLKSIIELTSISMDNTYIIQPNELNSFNFDVYIRTDHAQTGDFELEFSETPALIMGDKDVVLEEDTTKIITVTQEDGTILNYTVNFKLQTAYLDYLNFDYATIDFEPLIYEYEVTVPYNVKNLNVSLKKQDGVEHKITGNENLVVGLNTITIDVAKEGMLDKTYVIKVTREPLESEEEKVSSYDFSYTGNYQEFEVPKNGYYKIELWGAAGGRNMSQGGYVDSYSMAGGNGAFTSGEIYLEEGTKLYIYVGGKGANGSTKIVAGGYNGGGKGDWDRQDNEGSAGGGGATDVRLVAGTWNDFNSLKSRIMVAAGGGGGSYELAGGYGGALTGGDVEYVTGATQTTGYAFGVGQDGVFADKNVDVAGGGGGYYGGQTKSSGTASVYRAAGAGGSSFVSGCDGCNAISSASTSTSITHLNSPNHYSGYVFKNITMIAGNQDMPPYSGNTLMVGNPNNGYARITFVKGDIAVKDLEVENATLAQLFETDTYEYDVLIPSDNFETNISVITEGKFNIVGTGKVTLTVGTPHYITLMDDEGNLAVYKLNPYLEKVTVSEIRFEEIDYNFSPNIFEYDLKVGNSINLLTLDVIKENSVTYEVEGSLDLKVGDNTFKIIVSDAHGNTSEYVYNVEREFEVIKEEFVYTGDYQEFVAPISSYYKIELWGAAGGRNMSQGGFTDSASRLGGAGAYTSGEIYLEKGTKLYIYVGGKGTNGSTKIVAGGYNGGGRGDWDHSENEGSAGGGGATDVRLVAGVWNDFNSLKSRIMVAAGGGGASYELEGGYGGALIGGPVKYVTGATQTTGYAFGIGQDGVFVNTNVDVAGGGGGYYGGQTKSSGAASVYLAAGAGGSSFVSGCDGCDAIEEASTSTNIIHTGESEHYSGYVFENITMIAGNAVMPNYADTSTMTGNANNGYARITAISNEETVLETLTVENGVMDLEFVNTQYTYNVTIEDIDTVVEVNATTNNPDAHIGGIGKIEIPSGTYEHAVTLTEPNGNVTTYTLIFNRNKNIYKYLDDILVNGVSVPNFSPTTTVYNVTVPYVFDFVTITGVPNNKYQTVIDDGVFVMSDVDTLTRRILAVSEQGLQNQPYTINIQREKTSLIKDLGLPVYVDLDFDPNIFEYELELDFNVFTLNFNPVTYYKTAEVTIEGNKFIEDGSVITIRSHVEDEDAENPIADSVYTIKIKKVSNANYTQVFDYTGDYQTFTAPFSGYYKMEAWGASGGKGMTNGSLLYVGGAGAYTSGEILLRQGETLYIYVGGQGANAGAVNKCTGGLGGYNGGGNGGNDTNCDAASEPGAGGGGATDIRVIEGVWNDTASLYSRIMVAAGGSGGSYSVVGVPAGGLIGGKPSSSSSLATQIAGYGYGYAANGSSAVAGSGGSGSGYFGGYNFNGGYYAGGSGSSYISGHAGSIGTNEDGTMKNNVYTTITDSYNYTEKYFTNTKMIDGAGYAWGSVKATLELMPMPNGEYYSSGSGNMGNGAAKVTLLTAVSSNNYLDDIILNDGNIDIEFDTTVEDYEIYLDENEIDLKVQAIAKDEKAIITGNGNYKIPPNDSVIPITVTASDGSVRIYNLNVHRTPSTDSTPNEIKINGLTKYICMIDSTYCIYNFSVNDYSYELTVPFAIANVELLAITKSDYQKVIYRKLVDGEYVELENGKVELASGLNQFQVEVISEAEADSEDPQNSSVYNYAITRDPNGNYNVTDIKITDPEGVEFAFNPTIYEYFVTIPSTASSVTFEVTKELDAADVYVFGNTNLSLGQNDAYVISMAPNGESITYIFHIYKLQDSNVFLESLTVKNGSTQYELTPEFKNVINDYVVEVGSNVSSVNITATPESGSSTVSINNPSKLVSGINTATITVTSANGDTNIYELTIKKEKSSNANLANIEAVGYKLAETFNKDLLEYHVTVPKDVYKLDLVLTKEETSTTCTTRGNTNLVNVSNEISITCVAEDGTKKVYYLYVQKDISNINDLTNIEVSQGTLTPEFKSDTLSYTVSVDSDIDTINVKGILADENATITGNGDYVLTKGDNIIELIVYSELGEAKTYTVTVNRAASDDNSIKDIVNSQNSSAVKVDESNYLINVQYEVKEIEIEVIPNSIYAIASGSGKYSLKTGDNIVPISVTSESGEVANYTLTIVRDLSYNDDLSYIYVKEGGLNPVYKDTTIYYDVYVPYSTEIPTITFETEDPNAIAVLLNNDEPLEVGVPKEIVIEVTAQDKTNKKRYTLNVTRQAETTDELYLSSLEVSDGTLLPEFVKETFEYEVTVPYSVEEITLSATPLNSEHIVSGNKTYSLKVGLNPIHVSVSNADGIRQDYQIKVTREKSDVATLDNLVIKGHTLSPSFTKDRDNYIVQTSLAQLEFTTIKPTESDATYEVVGNENFVSGPNTVQIIVTAPDGITQKTYTLTVNRSASVNNNLASLEILNQTFDPKFHKAVTVYTLTVSNDVNNLLITAVPEDENATVTGDGLRQLAVGLNELQVVVTSEAGTTKTYTLMVTKEGNDNNYLEMLHVSEGELDETFNKENQKYAVTVPYEISQISLAGEAEVITSVVQGFGTYDLNVGENVIEIKVTSEMGNTRTYKVIVTREEMVSAKLIDLEVEGYVLDTTFDKNYYEYYVNVPNEVTSVTIYTTPEDPNLPEENITITGNENFEIGINEIKIEVTSIDGSVTETYYVYINRQLSSNNKLLMIEVSEGALDPDFNKDTMMYTVNVGSDVETIDVIATVEDAQSKVITGNGTHTLSAGENKIAIKVRSMVGIERTYMLTVNRAYDDNNNLESLKVMSQNKELEIVPEFNKDELKYTLNVTGDVKYVDIVAVAESDKATIVGDGVKELTEEVNTFEIVVTSEDGNDKTYTVQITREKSTNNNVTNIVPSVGQLTEEFNPDVHEYTLKLTESDLMLSFEVTAEDSKATVQGHESKAVSIGESVREIVITAEDGTTNTYTFKVVKESVSEARLESLTVKGYEFEFDPDTFVYNLPVSAGKKELLESEIEAIAKDADATVNMMGDLTLIRDTVNIYVIEVIAKDGYTTQEYRLNITTDNEEYTLRSEVYEINRDEEYVIGSNPNTNVTNYIGNFENDPILLAIYDKDGNKIEDVSKLAGTSMTIKLEKDGIVYDSLKVIVRGDVTKDGKVDLTDQIKLENYVGKAVTFDEDELLAAEVTKDGKVNLTDQVELENYVGKAITDLND